ncbi:histone H1/H5, partial [Ramicandelaber brevisporus]
TYLEMIKAGIIELKERKGSSRQALKKYIEANFHIEADKLANPFNMALRKGVETGVLEQPNGPSGPVKLAKDEKEAFKKK